MESDFGMTQVIQEGKNSFPPRKKNNVYQLVYNRLEEDDDEFLKNFGTHIEHLKAMDIQGDGDSSDLHLTSSQRVAQLLGLSDSDAWSVGSSTWANDTELRIDTTEDPSMEDTFQTELKEARMLRNQMETFSPIGGGSNNNLFEDNADFSMYNHVMHSTPIKDWNREVNRTVRPHVNISEILKDVPQNIQTEIFPTEDASVRFFQSSPSKEQTDKLTTEEIFKPQTEVSPTPSKLSFVKKLRNSLKKRPHLPIPEGEQIVDVTVKYCGPPRFDFGSTDCFFDDDVAQLCQNAEIPNTDYDKIFNGLSLTTQDVRGPDDIGILSNRVHFNTDDDYEDALSQDPSDLEKRDASRKTNPGNPHFSKYLKTWMETHKRHMFIFLILVVALLFVTGLVCLQTFPNETSPGHVRVNVTVEVTPNVTLNVAEHHLERD